MQEMVLYVFFLVQKAKLAVPPSLVSFLSELKKNFTNFYFFKLKLCQEAVSYFFLGLLQDEGKNKVKTCPTVVRLDHLRQALEKNCHSFLRTTHSRWECFGNCTNRYAKENRVLDHTIEWVRNIPIFEQFYWPLAQL